LLTAAEARVTVILREDVPRRVAARVVGLLCVVVARIVVVALLIFHRFASSSVVV